MAHYVERGYEGREINVDNERVTRNEARYKWAQQFSEGRKMKSDNDYKHLLTGERYDKNAFERQTWAGKSAEERKTLKKKEQKKEERKAKEKRRTMEEKKRKSAREIRKDIQVERKSAESDGMDSNFTFNDNPGFADELARVCRDTISRDRSLLEQGNLSAEDLAAEVARETLKRAEHLSRKTKAKMEENAENHLPEVVRQTFRRMAKDVAPESEDAPEMSSDELVDMCYQILRMLNKPTHVIKDGAAAPENNVPNASSRTPKYADRLTTRSQRSDCGYDALRLPCPRCHAPMDTRKGAACFVCNSMLPINVWEQTDHFKKPDLDLWAGESIGLQVRGGKFFMRVVPQKAIRDEYEPLTHFSIECAWQKRPNIRIHTRWVVKKSVQDLVRMHKRMNKLVKVSTSPFPPGAVLPKAAGPGSKTRHYSLSKAVKGLMGSGADAKQERTGGPTLNHPQKLQLIQDWLAAIVEKASNKNAFFSKPGATNPYLKNPHFYEEFDIFRNVRILLETRGQ